ncbi:mannonate dehydratase [Nocardioides baekrokdamisoli]|uniref:mannonate dehydratase n=1 Tax=Nocardioides baekrokdamisoli TaxID=1804624 RepID=A0A3G9J3G4_9ACTN|nr:mannonate dehydratase [Nocardioides baekrokdamisoli]BBH17549.1 mannonate dehydratase [Nocardioides baekrokdamisoli]
MRVSLGHIDIYDDRVATFAKQLGLRSVQLHTPNLLPGTGGHWTLEELTSLRERCDRDGLMIEGLENVPLAHFYKVQRGLPGRDEQLENYQKTIRNIAAVGIPLLGYNFLPTFVWRTNMLDTGRGGAMVTSFNLDDAVHGNALEGYRLTPSEPLTEPIDADQMWANHQYFLDAVLPVAEEVGVRLALHPDDPPVDAPLGGAARIFTTPTALVKAWDQAGRSSAWGLNFCLGTVSEMGGEDAVNAVIDALGPDGAIAYLHFRDVQGTVPAFKECFLGEGNYSPTRVLKRLHSVGFDGFLIDDHVPAVIGDPDTWMDISPEAYCSRGRSHAIGYLQGILEALEIAN